MQKYTKDANIYKKHAKVYKNIQNYTKMRKDI